MNLVCAESRTEVTLFYLQAALHRRLLYRVPDTYLITIPDDSGVAAYFAAAQIVYWRLFTLDREHVFGSYLVVQNNIDGVAEMAGRSLVSKSSTLQRAATFLQQVGIRSWATSATLT